MTLEEAKKILMTEEGFRKAYEELEEEYAKIRLDIRRAQNGMQVADKDKMQRDCGSCGHNKDGFCTYFGEAIEDAYIVDCPCRVEANPSEEKI